MVGIEKRIFSHLNWALFGLVLVIFSLGVLNLFSASALRAATGLAITPFYKKQLIWGAVGLLCLLVTVAVDYRHLKVLVWPLFGVSMILLLAVPIFGKNIGGARRWLDLGLMNFQPSELAKISILIATARLLATTPGALSWKRFFQIFILGAVPAGLIIIQPDLGTGLILFLLLGGMVLYKGLSRSVIGWLVVIVPAAIFSSWFILHDYQKQRILTFMDPGADPRGTGYHILQSQISMGSGKFWGKGFLEGTQSQLRFLPEKHTDFALAVFGEEWGFFGCFLLLTMFCAFLYQISIVSQDAKDSFGCYLAAGVFFYFFWQVLINMGMVLGVMPVVGIPLPFISYGGSATLVNFFMVGIVLNVSMRRFVFKQN